MKYLEGSEYDDGVRWMTAAGHVAERALCLKAKCGTIIEKNGEIIGEGYNAPPGDAIDARKCHTQYDFQGKPNYDRTCCMHAEWRAILDASRRNPEKLAGARLFFTRVDDEGNILKSGEPFCTVCSRFALDVGIGEFVLWNEKGLCAYDTLEYNDLSYQYRHPGV